MKTKSKIRIVTGDWSSEYMAASGKDAIRLFFSDILAGTIELHRLGLLGEWTNGKETIPFRIAPALHVAGKLSKEALTASLLSVGLDFSPAEITRLLREDAWMVKATNRGANERD